MWNDEQPGFNTDVLIQSAMGMTKRTSDWDRSVVLAFDGMTIKEGLVFSAHTNEIVGLVDVGKGARKLQGYTDDLFSDTRTLAIAKSCVQLIATTFDGQYSIPFAYFLVESETASSVAAMVHGAIVTLAKVRLDVKLIVCDGGGWNRTWMADVCTECSIPIAPGSNLAPVKEQDNVLHVAMQHPVRSGELIFVMSDPVHIIKKVVSNLHSSGPPGHGHTRRISRGNQWLEWDQFYGAWQLDTQAQNARIAPRVTRDHIERTGFTKLKVKFSAQILSRSFARAVQNYDDGKGQCTALVDFMLSFDTYLDLMNSGTNRGWRGEQEHLNYPIYDEQDPRLDQLEKMARDLEGWCVENQQVAEAARAAGGKAQPNNFLTWQLYYDFRMATHGFVAFCRHYLPRTGPDEFVRPRWCNQDGVEGHFSMIRAQGGAANQFTAGDIAQRQGGVRVRKVATGRRRRGNTTIAPVQDELNYVVELPSRQQTRKRAEQLRAEGRRLAVELGVSPRGYYSE